MSGSKFIARKVAVVTRVARCTRGDLRNSSCRRRPAQPCCVASLPLGATSTSPSDDDIMQGLLNQAQHSPVVTSQQDAQSSSRQAAHERSCRRATAISGSEQPSDTASCVIQDSVIEEPETVGSGRSSRCQTLASHMPLAARGAPASMDFHAMCSQLAQWRATHLTAHVPRHVFDAPALGAWVRHMRKLHKDGKLEQWKVEVLNALGFVWHLSDQDARWHHLYHQLRRYKLLHGSTTLDPAHSAADGVEWDAVARSARRHMGHCLPACLPACPHI
jgi:Helicase associated domain